MQSEKRKSIKSFFLPKNKKPRQEEQKESTVLDPSSSLPNVCSDFSDKNLSVSSLSIDDTCDVTSVIENSVNKSMPVDISKTCNDLPSQPKLNSYPLNVQNRSFRSNWFVNRSWLEYSVKNDRIYCFNCRHFGVYKTNIGGTFTGCGYNNWKRTLEHGNGLLKHEQSQSHIVATKNFQSFKLRQELQVNVIDSLDSGRNLLVRRNRDRLIKIASTLLLLAQQMIAFRGHDENENSSNHGNFIEILRWTSSTDPIVKSMFEENSSNATYLSHDIQNQLLNIMANQIRERISHMVNNEMYALIVDESRDISGKEQLSVVLRFTPDYGNNQVNDQNVVSELFLGFIRLVNSDADTLSSKIVEFLSSLNISLTSCIALCFDGASVMSGCNAGVHVLLRKDHMPKGVYIHCSCHCLNLIINDTCNVVPYMNDYFSIISTLYSYFTESGVTNTFFKKAQEDLKLTQASTLKLWQFIDSIINNYPAVIQALHDLSEEDSGTRSINAAGLLLHLKKSIFIISSFILQKLLGITEVLSDQLTSSSLDYARGEYLIFSIIQQISDLRNEKTFTDIYCETIEFCKLNKIDLMEQYRPRRTTVIPARFKECIIASTLDQCEILSTSIDFRDKIYYPLIDCILIELKDRFSAKTLSLLKSLSTDYPESENFLNIDDIELFCDHIDGDLSAIKNEFLVIKPMIQSKLISNIIEFFNELLPLASAFPNTIRMIRAAITIPISKLTCERNFSKIKLIKTYAKSSMNDDCLSDLTILATQRSFQFDFEQVIDIFANNHKNSRILLH